MVLALCGPGPTWQYQCVGLEAARAVVQGKGQVWWEDSTQPARVIRLKPDGVQVVSIQGASTVVIQIHSLDFRKVELFKKKKGDSYNIKGQVP